MHYIVLVSINSVTEHDARYARSQGCKWPRGKVREQLQILQILSVNDIRCFSLSEVVYMKSQLGCVEKKLEQG
jgi:hypothetical protein